MKKLALLTIFAALAYVHLIQCPPVEFKPEEIREVFKPEATPERFSEQFNRDPIEFLKALDTHIDANIKLLTPEQINSVTNALFKAADLMQNPLLKAQSITKGLDIVNKLTMDPALKAQKIVTGLGIVAGTGVDSSTKSTIIAKGLDILAKNNLLINAGVATPAFVSSFKNALQAFKNMTGELVKSGTVTVQNQADMRKSAENIITMLDATNNIPALHDALFDAAVDLMTMSDKQGSLINNKGRAQLISATSQLLTAQAIQGKTEKQVLNQIARMEQFILKFADATSMITDPERKSLSTLQNTIGQYNFPLKSHAAAISSLNAKIRLIESFNSGKAEATIPTIPVDAFTQAFSVLTPLENGRTFVDIFFEKILAADRSTFKLEQMKPEQKIALFEVLTNKEALPRLKGYASAAINIIKSIKFADIPVQELPQLASAFDDLINLNKNNQNFIKNILDLAVSKSDSLVSTQRLEAVKKIAAQETSQSKKDLLQKEIVSKEAQTTDNIDFVSKLMSSLIKNVALTADQSSTLTYATQTLLNRISEPNILTKVVAILGDNLATFPEKIRSTIFAQMLDRTSRINIDQKTFDTIIAPTIIKTIISDPTKIDTISTNMLTKLLLNHQQELAQPLFDALKKTLNKWSPTTGELERAAKIYSVLKNELLDNFDEDNTIFKGLIKTPAILDIFATTRPEILARMIEPTTMPLIAENLKAGFDKAIKDPSKQDLALNTIGKITELTMTHLQSEDPKKRPELMSETIALLSLALDYLARSGQGLALMNQPEGYWNDPQKNFLSQVTLSGQLLKTVRELQKMTLDPKLLNEFNKQLIAYAQSINIKEPGTNINTWSIKQNITRAISNLLELPSIVLTEDAKTVLLQSALNFVRGASAIRGIDNKIDIKEFYKNPFKTGPEFSRYEYLGDTENILLLLMTKNAKFNDADFKTLQTFKNQDIAAFRKAIEANDSHSEVDPKYSIAQAADAMKKTTETKAIIIKELDALSARIDLLEAFGKGDYAKVASFAPTALQEFPVFGEEGQSHSFAHHFIENILPKMLPSIKQEQAITIVSALLRPEMQVQLPREDYVKLLTSSPISQLLDKISIVTTKPLLQNLLKAINNPTIFDQKKLFYNKQIDELKDFINKKLPKEYASSSKSTEL